eukprot:331015_1
MDGLYENDEYTSSLVDQTNDSTILAFINGSDDHVSYDQIYEKAVTPLWITFTVAVGAWFVAAFVIKRLAELFCAWKENKISGNSCNERSFDRAMSKARKEMNAFQNSNATASMAPDSPSLANTFESYDGDFYIKYEDCGKVRSGFMKIQLKKSGANNGYGITGMCADADGYATITDGHVSCSGSAWWMQEALGEGEERSGLRVFSQGKFDFAASNFSGRWISNSGNQGSYSKFEGMNVNSTTVASRMDISVAVVAIAVPEQTTIPLAQEEV